MSKIKNTIDDGFNPELVETAFFDGTLEMPVIERPKEIIIPKGMIPFSKIKNSKTYEEFIVFYENDIEFADILRNPNEYLENMNKFPGIVSLDNSLYIDSPLIVQMANVYRNRAIGHYYQSKGIYVIPNVRWGDERSYTTCVFPEKFAFLGLPKNSIVSIGTYGCCKSKEERLHLRNGLISMLDEITPQIVLVYGPFSKDVFNGLENKTKFVNYPDWISLKRKRGQNGY